MEWIERLMRVGSSQAVVVRDALSSPRGVWARNLGTEVDWWAHYVNTKGIFWPEEFSARCDPKAPLEEPLIIDILDGMGERVEVLDVGAGPMTSLGKVHPGKELVITAVDPLADEYNRLLEREGISPPIRTMRYEGEHLLEYFNPDSFDIAYARNALDHSFDPILVIRNMVALVRPGGYVLLRHYPNVAESASDWGLHRWNFNLEDGHFVVWRPSRFGRKATDVTALLMREAEVETRLDAGSDDANLVCVIRKHG